jgi:DNA-binding MarR family transcriptional regulator
MPIRGSAILQHVPKLVKLDPKVPELASFTEILCNGLALRKASRRVSQFYDAALAPSGVRSTQIVILGELFLRRDAPPDLTELAAALVLDPSALGHNLRPLERDRLVDITVGDEDRRRRIISLTSKGLRAFERAYPLWSAAQQKLSDLFGEFEMAKLREVLLRIANDDRL